jgi:coproporphyrinogen III oxidase-like Fe-S oxidoreductase
MIESGKAPIESREKLSPLARAGETAAFGLRMTLGWPFEQFCQITGFDLGEHWATEMQHAVARGLAQRDDERFWLTRRGLRFADLVAEEFLRPDVAMHNGGRQGGTGASASRPSTVVRSKSGS